MKKSMETEVNTFDTGHIGMIHDTQFDYYEKKIATCSSDGYINIYDSPESIEGIKKIISIKAHEGPVYQICWCHPQFGNIIASCGHDNKVVLWEEKRIGVWGKKVEFNLHKAPVLACAWAPSEYGLILASGSADGTIGIMMHKSDDSFEQIRFDAHKGGVYGISWGPSTSSIYSEEGKSGLPSLRLVSGGEDNTVCLWVYDNAVKQFICSKIAQGESRVRDVSFSKTIGLLYDTIAVCWDDQSVGIIQQKDKTWVVTKLPKLTVPAWRVSWNPNGNMLAITAADNTTFVFAEISDGQWEQITEVNEADEK